jgi:hypothetical protein
MDTNLDENGMLLYINAGEEPGLAKVPIAIIQLSTFIELPFTQERYLSPVFADPLYFGEG